MNHDHSPTGHNPPRHPKSNPNLNPNPNPGVSVRGGCFRGSLFRIPATTATAHDCSCCSFMRVFVFDSWNHFNDIFCVCIAFHLLMASEGIVAVHFIAGGTVAPLRFRVT